MEIWDVYTEARVKTGKTIVRGEPLGKNEFHLVVHMWIVNNRGELLIQKRASGVKSSPNMWAITGGAAVAGDDSYSACKREVFEEIGIQANMKQAEVAFTIVRDVSICDVWVIRQDIDTSDCQLQVEEVSEVKWASQNEIRELITNGKFHQYFYLDQILNLINKNFNPTT